MKHRLDTADSWSNVATYEFARWLVEDVVGNELAADFSQVGRTIVTPTITANLAMQIRRAVTTLLGYDPDERPLGMPSELINEINWIEIAEYLLESS